MIKVANYLILLLLVFVLAVYGYFLFSIDWNNLLPIWSDEHFYYLNGLATYQFGSTKASFTCNLQGAAWLGADAHGFVYPILHGLFAKLIGWHHFNLVLLNQLIVLGGLILIFYQKGFSNIEKYWLALLYLAFPVTLQYSITFMQETLQSFFGLCIGLMFYHIQRQGVITKKKIALFLILVFIAGLFRPLWFFWVVLIFAFTKRKHILLHCIICIIYILFAFIYLNLFTEHVPNYFASLIGLLNKYQFEEFAYSFLSHFWSNIKAYLKDSFSEHKFAYLGMKYLILFIAGISFFKIIMFREHRQTNWAIFALISLNFFLLLGLYDAAWWREIRSLSILGYFYIPFLVKEQHLIVRYSITMAVLCCFFLNLVHAKVNIQDRYKYQIANLQKHQKINDFSKFISKKKPTIYIAYGFIPENDAYELLSMPLKTHQQQRIIYSVPYYGTALKKQADYILLRKNIPVAGLKKVFENNFFYLYELGEGQSFKIINQIIL